MITIQFKTEWDHEDVEIEGNASAIDPETDRKQEQWIRDQLAAGNQWAWCTAIVTATVEMDGVKFIGTATLGCCSYESEADFERCEGENMRAQAAADLKDKLDEAIRRGKIARSIREWVK